MPYRIASIASNSHAKIISSGHGETYAAMPNASVKTQNAVTTLHAERSGLRGTTSSPQLGQTTWSMPPHAMHRARRITDRRSEGPACRTCSRG